MTTLEKFNKSLNFLMYENVEFSNWAIKEAANKTFSKEQWSALTYKEKSAFRVSVIGQLAIEMAFDN